MTVTSTPLFGGTIHTLPELQAMSPGESDAKLSASIFNLRQQIDDLRKQLSDAETLMVLNMRERGATIADAGMFEVMLQSKKEYEYDIETLASLQGWIDADEYDRAVKPIPATVRVNKTELNRLAKRGSKIKEIIEAATTEIETRPILVIRRKAEFL